jgi:ABC-type nitrate/sulfonate/bicarbonate transport system permease component
MGVSFLTRRSAMDRLSFDALMIRSGLLVAAIVAWDLVVRTDIVSGKFLATPADVAVAAGELITSSEGHAAFASTGRSILVAFVLGTSLGFAVALALGASKTLRRAYLPPIVFILSTPKAIFLPIFVLIWGISGTSAAAFGAFEAFFYVVVNVMGGLGMVEEKHVRVAQAFKASRTRKYLDVILPSALPGLFAAVWFGMKHAFTGVMIAELWASRGGIGELIRLYSANLQSDFVLAIVLLFTLAVVLAGTAANVLEDRLNRWRGSGAGQIVGSTLPG